MIAEIFTVISCEVSHVCIHYIKLFHSIQILQYSNPNKKHDKCEKCPEPKSHDQNHPVSELLANKLLQLTADKLESGEREVFVLPNANSDDASNDIKANDGRIHVNGGTKSSDRMLNAKRILEDAEAEASVL